MSITVKFPWNKRAYLDAGVIVYKYKNGYTYRKYFGYFFAVLVVYGIYRAQNSDDYSMLLTGVLLTLYWYLFRGFIYKSKLKQSFLKEPVLGGEMKFVISKGGINMGGNMLPWDHVSLVILHPKGFLFQRTEGYPYLPATAFEKDEDVEYLFEIIEKHDIEIVRVK